MAIQAATTGNLENVQNIILAKTRFTMEHNMPCVELVEHLRLGKGEKQLTVPKVVQATAANLVDGQDITETADIGVTTTDLTTAEVGLKFILTDKLVRQFNEDVFAICGRQAGDAMGRKKDTDVIAIFSALNAGALGGAQIWGADNTNLTLTFLSACIARAKAHKFPRPIFVVHHPNAIFAVVTSAALTPSATYPLPHGWSEERLRDFYKFTLNQVPVFEDGNIAAISGTDSAYGVIASKNAMAVIDQVGFNPERERDASLRAWELVVTADYGVFELDDTYGAPMQYEMGDPAAS